MNTIKNNLFYASLLLTMSAVSCMVEDIIQPIELRRLVLRAGGIFDGEREAAVLFSTPETVLPLSNFGLEIRIDDFMEVGEEVEGANSRVSENAIAEILIFSDSVVMVTKDSVYLPGEDLSPLFLTDRSGRSTFEPRLSFDHLIGRNISFDPLIMQLVSSLEKPLHQTFLIDLTMDDGQTFALQSNLVLVAVE